MKLTKATIFIAITIFGSAMIAGCGSGTDMTQAEIDATKKGAAPMTEAQKAAIQDTMVKGANAAKESDVAWAKAHPNKVAEVNATRAARGLPPLGQ